ncbi:MAG: DUF1571 domain-containing protein [Planctomycetia bacterium]|nr:DUF1571 domain-containing protein [Planctomycetia bacterium]
MSLRMNFRRWACTALALALAAQAGHSIAQQPREGLREPVYRVAQQQAAADTAVAVAAVGSPASRKLSTKDLADAAPGEHPLLPAVRWAKHGLEDVRAKQDYSCDFVKRERIDGELGEAQYVFMKVRHEPFSVYLRFKGPDSMKGQEVIYVRDKNNGELLAHPTGIKKRLVGTVSLKPNSMLAMSGNRYPITEIGILHLVERLIEVGEHDMQYGECEVELYREAKINERSATCIQVHHPVARRNFLFHLARIYVDDELNVPVRYEAYEWPKANDPEGEPVLLEEYTYYNIKFDNNFTDLDFDQKNPEYDF